MGRRLLELDLHLPDDGVRAALREAVLEAGTPPPVELDMTDRFGRAQSRRLTARPLLRSEGEVHGVVVTLADSPGAPDALGARHPDAV